MSLDCDPQTLQNLETVYGDFKESKSHEDLRQKLELESEVLIFVWGIHGTYVDSLKSPIARQYISCPT